ncbi:MAG: TolB family protein [Bacteroidota bacterium]
MHKSILFFTILLCPLNINAQNDDLHEIFVEAESHYLFSEYELANPLYLILDDYMAGNANIKFKIGNCYLHIPDEKTKAIPYLQEAVQNASYDAKPESFRETRAPLEAYFALASAYRINYEFQKALETYVELKKLMTEEQMLRNADFIDQQINACHNALSFLDYPVRFDKQNLGPDINLGSMNVYPAISGDGNTLVYTEKRGLENTIYYLKKEEGEWGTPVEITSQLGGERDIASNSLNMNGTELYLYKNDNFDGNIYVSYLENGSWSEIKKLNRNINTRFYESHACISPGGNKLYFTSNRPGGEGGLDIYISEKNSKGQWGKAKNIGPVINTAFNEDAPFISNDGTVLYFSSEGHKNMGGYDIFSSKYLGDAWGSPTNVGYPINTPDNDLFFNPVNNGQNAYYSMTDGYKEKDIFYLDIKEKLIPTYEIKGIVSLSDTTVEFDDNYTVLLFSETVKDTIDIAYPNKTTGYYSFRVEPDDYSITYKGLGYLTVRENLTIQQDHPNKEEIIDVILEPDPNYVAESVKKMDFSKVQEVKAIDSSILITDVIVRDVSDSDSTNEDVLYYTVQLMALYNPVDVSFFELDDIRVVYNEDDRFYRYTTGNYKTKEEAYRKRNELISRGYPDDLWVKTVFRRNDR